METRRKLHFKSLDDVRDEVQRLAASGYSQTGNWDLAQICGHLDNWLRYPLDGYPRAPLPVRMLLGVMRTLAGKRLLRKTLETGFRDGGPTMPESIPQRGAINDADAVRKLVATLDRFRSHAGPFHPSPIFGQMDRETWNRLQVAHCQHHLQFLNPEN